MREILIAVPHAGVRLVPELADRVLSHVDERFLRSQSDMYTDRIYVAEGTQQVVYPWSRFVADPNRYEGQTTEGGIVPLTDFGERPIYREGLEPSAEEQQRLVEAYHRPHHLRVSEILDQGDFCFFIDAHSMMSRPPLRSPDAGRSRPDACLSNCGDTQGDAIPGGRPLTCSPGLTRYIQERLAFWMRTIPAPEVGLAYDVHGSVQLNTPFLGGHGVRTHARPEGGIPGLQFEFNQRLWVDEERVEPLPGRVEWMQEVLGRLVADIAAQDQTLLATAR